MIKLILDDLEISVKQDNPLYKILKRFDGESFTVNVGEDSEKTISKPAPPVETVAVEAESYYNLFSEAFPEEFLKTPTGAILRSHLDNVFTSGGTAQVVRVGEDAYKNAIYATRDYSFALVDL